VKRTRTKLWIQIWQLLFLMK